MTADERLARVRAKVERGKQHIHQLESELRAFFKTRPYTVGTKRNPETRRLVYYITNVRDTPVSIATIAGDVLQNLRSALDHLAYQLVLIGTGQPGPFLHVYFPISDDAAKYRAESPGRVKGMRQDAIDAINAVNPYKGGNDTLWRLHKLNNVDKHRLLITVGSSFGSVNIAPVIQRESEREWSKDPTFREHIGKVKLPPLFIKAETVFPLKVGEELFIDAPDAEVNAKMQFSFDVAFSEPQVAEGEPLLETLQQMADEVDNLVVSFKPLLV
jgi:hypothetical protein